MSVLRNRAAGSIEDRFGERKLQHDLAVVVGHLDDRALLRAIGAVGLEQFPDHGARHFPGAIEIDKHFAVGVGIQLVADTGVEVISRLRQKLHSCWGLAIGDRSSSRVLYRTPAASRKSSIVIRSGPNNPETLDPTLF
jgi:hypothetical protein